MREALQDAIRTQGRSRRALAQFLGISEATLSRYIRGQVDPPTSRALRLAVLLNQPVEALFGDLLRPGPNRPNGGARRRGRR